MSLKIIYHYEYMFTDILFQFSRLSLASFIVNYISLHIVFNTDISSFNEKMDALRAKGTVKEFEEIEYRADWLRSKYVGQEVPLLREEKIHITKSYL